MYINICCLICCTYYTCRSESSQTDAYTIKLIAGTHKIVQIAFPPISYTYIQYMDNICRD